MMYDMPWGGVNLGRLNVVTFPPNLFESIEKRAGFLIVSNAWPLHAAYPTGTNVPANKVMVPIV